MAFGTFDLRTRAGAQKAATIGSVGAFLLAAATAYAGYASAEALDTGSLVGQIGLALVALQVGLCLVAGFRLWQGKGAYWAMAVAALVAIEMATKLATMTALPGLIVNLAFFIALVVGIRGALALRGMAADPVAEI